MKGLSALADKRGFVHWLTPTFGVWLFDHLKRPPLHFGVVAIEKGAFGLPSTMVANFTYLNSMQTNDLC